MNFSVNNKSNKFYFIDPIITCIKICFPFSYIPFDFYKYILFLKNLYLEMCTYQPLIFALLTCTITMNGKIYLKYLGNKSINLYADIAISIR